VASRQGTALNYILQDHLGSTSATADTSGTSAGTIKYFPFGSTRPGSATLSTDRLFTGQRLDTTGLYYYNARYYDPSIGRFISPDKQVQLDSSAPLGSSFFCINLADVSDCFKLTGFSPTNPQCLNRYSYVLNGPLSKTDPSGCWTMGQGFTFSFCLIFYFSVSYIAVWDGQGNQAGLLSGSVGAGTPSVSLTYTVQHTDADSIDQLAGLSGEGGASASLGLGTLGIGGDLIGSSKSGYKGENVNIGIGGPIAEVHGCLTVSSLVGITHTGTGNTTNIYSESCGSYVYDSNSNSWSYDSSNNSWSNGYTASWDNSGYDAWSWCYNTYCW
jgi:RHS repeat-associated protein